VVYGGVPVEPTCVGRRICWDNVSSIKNTFHITHFITEQLIMAHKSPFKIVIAGASVSGLSLANMLQANDIDYVVLEAHQTIAPQVGASIGLLPHGNRILDQLGLYEKVMEIAPPIQTFNFRDAAGSVLAQHQDMDHRLIDR
jgi:hypothetical protein